jgi:hypothetical protein
VWVQCMASRLQPRLGKGHQGGGGEGRGDARLPGVGDPEVGGASCALVWGCGEVSLRVQTRGVQDLLRQKPVSLFMLFGWSSISVASIMMEAIRSSETLEKTATTRCYNPEDDFLQSVFCSNTCPVLASP